MNLTGFRTYLVMLVSGFVVPLLSKHGLNLDTDQQAWFVGGVMTVVGWIMRTVTKTPPGKASQTLPPPVQQTVIKVIGFLIVGILVSASMTGCKSMGVAPPQNTQQQIAYAYSGVTASLNTLAQATSQGLLSSSEATSVNSALLLAKSAIDQANSIVTSNQPEAVSVLANATKDIAMISAYLTCKQQKGATCQLSQ